MKVAFLLGGLGSRFGGRTEINRNHVRDWGKNQSCGKSEHYSCYGFNTQVAIALVNKGEVYYAVSWLIMFVEQQSSSLN
jgi:hypothetical protein